MKSMIAFALVAILSIPTVSFAWDEDGLIFNQTNQCTSDKCLMEQEAEAKLANYYDPALEASYSESEITMRTVCVDNYKFLLTVDNETGNLDVLQILGSEGFPLSCDKE